MKIMMRRMIMIMMTMLIMRIKIVMMRGRDDELDYHDAADDEGLSKNQFHNEMVSTRDSESCDPSSNLDGTFSLFVYINVNRAH